jgi:hypothetical protein
MVIKGGKLHGNDGSIAYTGTAVEDPVTGRVKLEVDIHIPAYVELVGGASAMQVPHLRHLSSIFLPALANSRR